MKQLIIMAVLLLSSCSTDHPLECQSTVIDKEQYLGAESDPFDLEAVQLTKDGCLKITLSYGGGCGEVSASLVDNGDIFESDPTQRNLRLIFVDNDNCEALKKSNFYFDIDNLKIPDDKRVRLNFTGTDVDFLYEY